MDKQLIKAVQERVELGIAEEDIITELQAAGYTTSEAKEVFYSVNTFWQEGASPQSSTTPETTKDTKEITATDSQTKEFPDIFSIKSFIYVGLALVVVSVVFAVAIWLFDSQGYLQFFPR